MLCFLSYNSRIPELVFEIGLGVFGNDGFADVFGKILVLDGVGLNANFADVVGV